jgi:hypothetical protein
MDLKNFITESLYQIVGGINAAQEKIAEFNCEVESNFQKPTPENDSHEVYFDVALTVVDEQSEPSSAKLLVMGFPHFGNVTFDQLRELVSRVKFSVPLSFVQATKEKYPYFDLNAH